MTGPGVADALVLLHVPVPVVGTTALVFRVIEEIVTGRRRYLIEALASDIARTLCERFAPVTQAIVTVRKPNAPVNGVLDHVEVTIAWPQ